MEPLQPFEPLPHDTPCVESRYVKVKNLENGHGSHLHLWTARDSETGALVCVKRKVADPDEGVSPHALREAVALRELSHPHVLRLLDLEVSPERLLLVSELADTNLREHLWNTTRAEAGLPAEETRFLFWQLLDGMDYLHSNRFLHRHLHASHILLKFDSEFRAEAGLPQLKISGFSRSRTFTLAPRNYTRETLLMRNKAPELLLGLEQYTIAVDLWSCGCILGEMAKGRPLFPGDSEVGTLLKIFQCLGTPTKKSCAALTQLRHFDAAFPRWPMRSAGCIPGLESFSQLGVELLDSLLCYDHTQRITARAAKAHAYFQQVSCELDLNCAVAASSTHKPSPWADELELCCPLEQAGGELSRNAAASSVLESSTSQVEDLSCDVAASSAQESSPSQLDDLSCDIAASSAQESSPLQLSDLSFNVAASSAQDSSSSQVEDLSFDNAENLTQHLSPSQAVDSSCDVASSSSQPQKVEE